MDALVVPETRLARQHFLCPMTGGDVTKDVCQTLSWVGKNNANSCVRHQCGSPWRLCAGCIRESRKPDVVVRPGERLCQFHIDHGEATKRPTSPMLVGTVTTKEVQTTEEGLAILQRVRVAISNARLEVIPVERIVPMPNQPRKHFNQDRLRQLADSIGVAGQIMPGYVRVLPGDEVQHYQLVDGERRWRAILMARIATYRAMVVDIDDVAAQYLVSIIANFNREGHTTLELMESVRVSFEELKLSAETISEVTGFSVAYVYQLYNLRHLVPEVLALLDPELPQDKQLSRSAAIAISKLEQGHQLSYATKVISREIPLGSLRTVVQTHAVRTGQQISSRASKPSDHRRDIVRRVEKLGRSVGLVRTQLAAMPPATISGWSPADVESMIGDLNEIQAAITASIDALKKGHPKAR